MQVIKLVNKGDYVILEIDNGKVNAIDTALVKNLHEKFLDLDADEEVKGVILSGRPNCFSAGLDIAHLAKGGYEGGVEFWKYYHLAVQAMIRFSKPFVCAITGYAPAGATILTLCADYRIMGKGDKHKLGMHEFKLSMQIPELLCDIFSYYLGEKEAWKAVQLAKLFNSEEALKVGLIQESVEVEEVLERAEKVIQRYVGIYPPVFKNTKSYLRKGLLAIANGNLDKMIEEISAEWNDPYVQKSMELFLLSLKK